ncbi:hypothetical protein [Spirillospora sp. NPDC048819]|uniref:hypothetical protein n=1 Tax=Spirillospora sp. NPDC048819 TaxID=3155268 RepID=UPI0033C3587A
MTVTPAGDRPGAKPATLKVKIVPGKITRLDLRLKMTVTVWAPTGTARPNRPVSRRPPT